MKAIDALQKVLQTNQELRLVEENIYSVLSESERKSQYDKIAPLYDLVVGTRFYNALMWGCSSKYYSEFARAALDSNRDGLFLDAGCGSMLFTARGFCESTRTIIAFDKSLEMLRLAKKRVLRVNGSFPSNIVLLQADVFDLPFQPKSFQTVLSLAIVHLFEDAGTFVKVLRDMVADEGSLYVTSLAQTGRLTDVYLNFLGKTGFGGIARPKTDKRLKEIFRDVLGENTSFQTRGNFIFATVKYE
jgi:ubiquinone/menaquinone biosynthesis C-methylase UbiE